MFKWKITVLQSGWLLSLSQQSVTETSIHTLYLVKSHVSSLLSGELSLLLFLSWLLQIYSLSALLSKKQFTSSSKADLPVTQSCYLLDSSKQKEITIKQDSSTIQTSIRNQLSWKWSKVKEMKWRIVEKKNLNQVGAILTNTWTIIQIKSIFTTLLRRLS